MGSVVPEGWVLVEFGQISSNRKTKFHPEIDSERSVYLGLEHLGVASRKIRDFGNSVDVMSIKTKFYKGDTLFGKLRPYLRKIVYPDFDGICSTDILALSPSKNTDAEFLFYICSSDELIAHAVESSAGNVMPRTSWGDLVGFPILYPPLPEQKKIASILTSVDEVIESIQKQIDKLQDLKKATTNDLLTKGIGHTEFKDSELGRIPKRWEVLKLNELCSPTSPITYGVLKPGNYVDGGIPLLQVKDLKDGSVDNSGIHRISTSLDAEYARSRVRFHDILISLIGTVGRVSLMPKVTETYNIHRNIGRIRLENPEWVFLHLQSQIGVQQIQLASSGSSQSALNLSALKEFPVPIPPLKEQSDIVSIISSLSDAITTNYRKLRLTQSLKKSLMQDLLTGKVRVTVN
jgi:type I restriction enzyme S subunit